MKNKSRIFLPLILLIFTLTACGPHFYVSKYDIEFRHELWAESIGLFTHKNLKVRRYETTDNSIRLELQYDNGLTGYKELCDVVNAHNKFVEDNPDYFPEDTDITFTNKYASEYSPSFFSNISDGSNGIDCINDLIKEKTAKLSYMYIDVRNDNTETEASDEIQIDVPIVILASHDNSYTPKGEAYAFLKEFPNIRHVVIDFWEPEYDKQEIFETISDYAPGAQIIEAQRGEDT